MSRIPGIICGNSHQNVFNCDETGLFFREVSDKTLAERGKEYSGGKLAKERERVTVMMCCSSTIEKLKPLVIGKARKLVALVHSIQQNFLLFGGQTRNLG